MATVQNIISLVKDNEVEINVDIYNNGEFEQRFKMRNARRNASLLPDKLLQAQVSSLAPCSNRLCINIDKKGKPL